MEQRIKREEAIKKLRALFRQKGYSSNFSIGSHNSVLLADLDKCLKTFLQGYDAGKYQDGSFELKTGMPYDSKIYCHFYLKFDEQQGFKIEKMQVSSTRTHKMQTYEIHNNSEILGSQAVYSLFPKPKPWEDIMKGKFRL
ncbi:hypothetical protein FXV77_05245 [Sphingobacterium phlebotomi]|uniref:Uncharacterized protein n=1 Tax=Sphingobacterium phlebotomi TaxID=2605433 RepID=A0A5D4HAQ8_9SPHI|nr:hypothetical protein [Sphingobacterium phlebotomi]TYR37412.1 hypothetical protein FXV77_05245 [Sphingobacterium phlebotomi]